jgi:alpha-L-fucosidase 2
MQNAFRICLILTITILPFLIKAQKKNEFLPPPQYNLKFNALATTWDEAMPLGNGMVGSLIWKKGDKLRMSLDRADLWDLRPTDNLDKPEWSFLWVQEQWKNNTYQKVQKLFDEPYDNNAGPSKIPAAALEFNIAALGEIESVELLLDKAVCEVKWKNGVLLQTFVHAKNTVGWFRFKGLKSGLIPELVAPAYNLDGELGGTNPVDGQDLRRLGYQKGQILKEKQSITYNQKGWGGFQYQVNVRWQKNTEGVEGCWSISSEFPNWAKQTPAEVLVKTIFKKGFSKQLNEHQNWWQNFWAQSSISLPDEILTKQWFLETYKLGAATGNGAPPISLQAVWTADNGKLPPWKGDFHNDLNTQLSYWSSYSSNHLSQETGYIDWMERNKPEFERYTRQYFQTSGINVPGVATFTGQPMGGWIQYAFSPTVSAWLAQHYYLHWRYSMDRTFLEQKAYPWLKKVATHLEELSVVDSLGFRKLPLSSSPEIFDNSRKAWFPTMTNYDLALVRWTFEHAAELATELGKTDEAKHWTALLNQFPNFDITPEAGFTFAKGFPYEASHRHFSHLMAFHPLGLVDWSKGEKDQKMIENTLKNLDKYGSDWFCGYSFSWLGNLRARAMDGEGAAKALRIFADNFCLKNSFHANGDQSKSGLSKFTYRPFTLEGNFAFAAGIQEMLLQSHTGVVHIFPAIPKNWENVRFDKLRTEGAFLISVKKEKGLISSIQIVAEKGGVLKLKNPFGNTPFECSTPYTLTDGVIVIKTKIGQVVKLK